MTAASGAESPASQSDPSGKRPACYCFSGGGTGGHLTPGLAVAAALRVREPGCRIIFIGSDRPLERAIVSDAAEAQYAVPVASSQMCMRNPIRFVWRNWRGYRAALKILMQEQPRAVIGLGGFVSAPAVYAAARIGIPTLLLEQNAVSGAATRWLRHHADRVCLSFPELDPCPVRGARPVVTGNPVRKEIVEAARRGSRASPGPRTLLVLGGSQGAAAVNSSVLHLATLHPEPLRGWRIVHQTGIEHLPAVRESYQRIHIDHEVESFFSDMPERYQQATLVISRAGGTTLAELACAGCPAVLIPYPRAAHDHQSLNAILYELAGGARIVEEGQTPRMTAERLANAVLPLLKHPHERAELRRGMQSVAQPAATDRVIDALQSLLEQGAHSGRRP